jgi:hypothetical protein
MENFLKVIGLIALIFVTALVFTYPVMWLMNYVFSSAFLLFVFGVAKLKFWHTYALSLVLGLLFRSGK